MVKKTVRLALLTSVAVIIFMLETYIPLPVTDYGIKLGLSNVVTLFTAYAMGWREAGTVLGLRIFLSAFLAGRVGALLYSVAGGVLSYLVICALKNVIHARRMWITSIAGAIAHNTGQLLMACYILGTWTVIYYFPVLLLSAIITGLFTGLCAGYATEHMKKINII